MAKSYSLDQLIAIPLGMLAMIALNFQFSYHYDPCTISDAQFDRYLLFAGIGGLVGAYSITKFNVEKIIYLQQFILRFVLGYLLFYSAYSYFWYQPIPDINLITLYDTPFKDIQGSELNKLFYKVTPGISKLQGYLSLICLGLLLTRKTAFLGFALSIPMYAYIYASNVDPACQMTRISILLMISIGGLIPEVPHFMRYAFTNDQVSRKGHPFSSGGHLYNTLTLFKYFIMAGLIVFFINKPNKYRQYYANNLNSPIKGVWTIKDVELNMNSDKDYQTDSLFQANKIYLSSSRYGKIKMNDTLSTFEYMVDPQNHQFEMWNFYDYRKLDLKGKFETVEDGTIKFVGKNGKDTVSFIMVQEEGFPIE